MHTVKPFSGLLVSSSFSCLQDCIGCAGNGNGEYLIFQTLSLLTVTNELPFMNLCFNALRRRLLICLLLTTASTLFAQKPKAYNAVYSGIPWFDEEGEVVSAHGANIVKENGRYYLFGERHSGTTNAFAGVNCYSSIDLYNWKFEVVALSVQPSGKLGPNRVGERPKVMKCPTTGEYLLYLHVDSIDYKDPFTGNGKDD
jgi:hypothetical protein